MPDAVQTLADGLESALDLCAPTSVEHPPRVPPRPAATVPPGGHRGHPRRLRQSHDERGGGGAGQDVPDGQDSQRRPGGPRWSGQDVTRRGTAVRHRRDPPPGSRRGRQHRHRLRPRGGPAADLRVARHRPVRARGPQDQRARHARATPTSSATSPPRSAPPTSPSSWCRRSRASRCRPRSCGGWPSDLGLPRAFFVNKLDRERASFSRTLDQLKEKFGAGVAPLQLPIGEEAEFRGVVDLLDDTAVIYANGSGTGEVGPIPAEMETEEHSVHDALVEGIVVADDDLMERYLADETIASTSWRARSPSGIARG